MLLLSASSGAGHIRAAQAIEQAFRQTGAAAEVRHVDALQYTNKVFRNLYSKTYIDVVNNAPDVFGWLYDKTDKPWKNERRRLAFDKLNTRKLVRLLRDYRPDITICTHFLPAEIIAWLRAKERLKSRQAIVVTDFDVHAMWLVHHYEQYFVAIEESRFYLEQLGISPDKITVTGVPIDPVFLVKKDRQAMRDKYGLRQDVPAILVSAGGFGIGGVEEIVSALRHLGRPAQIIAICGRNEELKQRMDGLIAHHPASDGVTVKVVGFTTEMDEYMAASDLLLGKPGGLTTWEALARGLAFVIVNPIPGQEERNSDHLLEEGVAIRCNSLPVLPYKIGCLLDDPSRLAKMRTAALNLARPRAAFDIVDKLLAAENDREQPVGEAID
ncbi:MAG TPA: glycosyltransferase [Blastocatellia bacterium]|nr:glycosyltransferase [Blastocatellia bacterium]